MGYVRLVYIQCAPVWFQHILSVAVVTHVIRCDVRDDEVCDNAAFVVHI